MELEEEEESESSDEELDDDEYQEALNKLSKLRKNQESKMNDEVDENDKNDNEDNDGDDDEDIVVEEDIMEKEARDFKLYYSPLDSIHELYFVKIKIEELAKKDMASYKQLEAALTEEEKSKFNKAMGKAEEYQKYVEENQKKIKDRS